MNEPRFIELLNLYVDQQLSPQEAAELEAEIQKNPVRHRTYQQYCRMQKACAQLFEHERSAAPAYTALGRAMADADRKVVAFPAQPARRSLWPVGFSVAALAAAACVAFVVVQRTNPGAPVSGGDVAARSETGGALSVSPDSAEPAARIVAVEKQAPVMLTSAEEFKPVFTVQPLRSLASGKADGLFVTSSTEDAQLLDWTRDVQLKPLRKVSVEEFAFDQRAGVDKPAMTQGSATSLDEPSVEMVTFEFTK